MSTDETHQVIVPIGGSPRPACFGIGPSTLRADEVTCPDCLSLAAERSTRVAEAEVHDAHAIPAGDEPVRVLKFAIEISGRDRSATEFRPLPSDWNEMTPRERGDYLTRMERHLSTSGKEWARFDGIVEAPAEELTPAEVAELCGLAVSTVRRWAATGRLKAKGGTPLTFRRDDLFPHLARPAGGGA